MTTLINSLNDSFTFNNNIVVEIDGTFFGKYQPDSGLVIDPANLLVSQAQINPTQIDIKKATTQINSTSVTFLDGATPSVYTFTNFLGADDQALIEKEISIYFGRVGEAMDFSEYIEINKYIISDVKKSNATYVVKAKSQEDKTLEPAFDQQGTLDDPITDSAEFIVVQNGGITFPDTGIIKIESEYIRYIDQETVGGITTFQSDFRGFLDSDAAAHTAGNQVNYVEELKGNPIDLILQLLISSGGGGPYDVLTDGAGIDQTLIDIDQFEEIRDLFFPLDVFTLYVSNLDRLINFIEDELFVPNNVRLIKNSMDNKLSLAILALPNLLDDTPPVNDSNTVLDTPKWDVTKNEMVTVIKVEWNWSEGQQRFLRSQEFEASDANLTTFGRIKGTPLRYKGVQDIDNGQAIAEDRARRFLQRFSTPRATVKLSAFMDTFPINIGDTVSVTAKNLPQGGGTLGMSSAIELVNRGVNFSTGVVTMTFKFTEYSNVRAGLISPSPCLDLAITNQRTFEVPDGDCYEVGYVLRLWDYENKTYYPDPINTVESINGNFITMENDWITPLTSNAVLFFADYDDASEGQKARYAFVVGNTDFFDDGTKGYQIIL